MTDCERIEPFYAHTIAPAVSAIGVPVILLAWCWTVHPSLVWVLAPFYAATTFVLPWLVARLGEYDLVVGARAPGTQAGLTRRGGNAVLNGLASFLTERQIPDLTSGFRAARRECLVEFLHLLPNGFSTPTTTTMAFLRAGYNVAFEPVEARPRVGASKIRLSSDGPKFLLIMMRVMTIFSPLRIFLPIAIVSLLAGTAYGIYTVIEQGKIPNGAVLLIMFAVIVFLVGLVSDQVAALRFDGRK